MKATAITHYYRGHPILVIAYENNGQNYYTSTNEATNDMTADVASDDPKNAEAYTQARAYATEAAAIRAEHEEIEEHLGPAGPEEIRETLDRILADADATEVTALNQAIASYRKENGDDHTASHANKQLADTLAQAVDGTENSNNATR